MNAARRPEDAEGARSVAMALGAFAGVVAAASLLRVPYLWGLGASGEYGWFAVAAGAALALLTAGSAADAWLGRTLARIPDRFLTLVVVAAAPGVCWWTRVQLPWMGDQLLWLRQIDYRSGFLHQIEPIPYSLIDVSRHLLPRDESGLLPGPALVVALLAPVWVLLCRFLAGEIAGNDPARRRLVWFLLLAAPQGLLYHGYVESYGVLLLFITATAWLGCRALRTGRPGGLWVAVLGAAASHLQALGALPAVWLTARTRRAAVWAAAGTLIVVGAAAGWYVFAGRQFEQQKKLIGETLAFLFPPGRLYDPFLGAHHLLGVANIALLTGGPLLWVAPRLPWRRVWVADRARFLFLLLLALPGVAGIVFIRLSLGALRDWDLFASYLFVFLPLFAWGWLARAPRGLPRFSALLLALAVGHGAAWVFVDTARDRGFDRAARLYGDTRLFSPDSRGSTGDELAYIERVAKNPEGAAAWYGRAAAANPTNWRFFNNQAAMLISLGRSDEAMPPLREAVSQGPNIPEPYATLGSILVNQDASLEARDVVQRGIDKTGGDPRLYFIRGVAEAKLHLPDIAAASLDTAVTLRPGDEEFLRYAAQIAMDAHDYARAVRHLESLVSLEPGRAEFWQRLGRLAAATGDTARANEANARYRELSGDN